MIPCSFICFSVFYPMLNTAIYKLPCSPRCHIFAVLAALQFIPYHVLMPSSSESLQRCFIRFLRVMRIYRKICQRYSSYTAFQPAVRYLPSITIYSFASSLDILCLITSK